ncbi:MAG: hypothetical protein M3O50_13965 [Myxococcota bacterium]|nr:hypothetical protein [Myxococcota bacterium]
MFTLTVTCCPASMVYGCAGAVRVIVIGVNVTVTDALLLGSFTLVAVIVVVAPTVGLVAVNTVATPVAVVVGTNVPEPALALHVTPPFDPSLPTVAVKFCVAPPIIATGTVGIATVIGVSVIVAVVDFVGSFTLVAVNVTVAVAAITVVGALYVTPPVVAPVSVPAPVPMLHVTPELDPSLATVAVNACDCPVPSVTVSGLIAFTLIAVSGTVTAALFVGSLTLVAVTVALAVDITAGAV